MEALPEEIRRNLYVLLDNAKIPPVERSLRKIAVEMIRRGIESVLPPNLLRENIEKSGKILKIQGKEFDLRAYDQVLIIGGGKATGLLAQHLIRYISADVAVNGIINIPKGQNFPPVITNQQKTVKISVNFARHPVPDEDGIKGTEKMLSLIKQSPLNTLVIALISGGGSALLAAPTPEISLEHLQQTNRIMLAAGLAIQEINFIRKHISMIKGGRLAEICHPRPLISLVISDVVGDQMDAIASGPTVPDNSTFSQAIEICRKYNIWNELPKAVLQYLNRGAEGLIEETPKPNSPIFSHTWNFLLGSVKNAVVVIQNSLRQKEIKMYELPLSFQGEARIFGERLVKMDLSNISIKSPTALYKTGELTVTLRGNGVGGRNQEMLASFLLNLKKNPNSQWYKYHYVIISAAFDGIEGNSPAMGGLVDSSSLTRLENLPEIKEDSVKFLAQILAENNSHSLFQSLQDCLITGMTYTNVNDLLFILIAPKQPS